MFVLASFSFNQSIRSIIPGEQASKQSKAAKQTEQWRPAPVLVGLRAACVFYLVSDGSSHGGGSEVTVVATEFDVGRGKKFERVAVEGDRAIAANRMRVLWLSDFAMDVESRSVWREPHD